MVDFERLFEDHFVEYWTHGKNVTDGWVNTQCPHCDDHSNHLGFNPFTGACVCWKCGGHSTAFSISKLIGLRVSEVERIMQEYESLEAVAKALQPVRNKGGAEKIDLPGGELERRHKLYLQSRRFDPDEIEQKYKIRGTNHLGEWAHRIIIPIMSKGKVVSFQSRDVTGKSGLRYKTLSPDKEIIHHKDILYNFDNIPGEACVLVEGIFDVWRLGDGAVCPFGTTVTDRQKRLLMELKRVFVLFDPEEHTQAKARKLAIELADVGVCVEIITLPDGDPAELSKSDAAEMMRDLKL